MRLKISLLSHATSATPMMTSQRTETFKLGLRLSAISLSGAGRSQRISNYRRAFWVLKVGERKRTGILEKNNNVRIDFSKFFSFFEDHHYLVGVCTITKTNIYC